VATIVAGMPSSPILRVQAGKFNCLRWPRTDTVAYVAIDQSGLTSTSTRTVIIRPADAPSIVPTADASTTATTTTASANSPPRPSRLHQKSINTINDRVPPWSCVRPLNSLAAKRRGCSRALF
jgi:hypothetical protein